MHRQNHLEQIGGPPVLRTASGPRDGLGHLAELSGTEAQLFARDDVPDPYYGEDDGFDEVLAQIEKAADQWADRLRDQA
ncbi:hypothetical protein E0H50_01945 [Kribbella sindirgiensis]|uniref:Phosphotyrosine protein phosphatase I domain-containing protein n=1 Tax=Kribbella sindirgiensis TaxID=1124744 RepID=A0A4R0JF65_9ACTN|nr:hypothetical protein E0H50_01945 [Kribbella sindirgiensis]